MLAQALERGKDLLCPRVDRAEAPAPALSDRRPGAGPRTRYAGHPRAARDCLEVAPEAVDWVLVPGLAFDARGYRLGRGAGHYDRLLPTLRPDVPRWALIHDCQWVEDLPVEPHDVPLDGVVSPAKERSSRRRSPSVRLDVTAGGLA